MVSSNSDKVIAQLEHLKVMSVTLTMDEAGAEIHRIVDEAIAEIEFLQSVAGAVSHGPSVADIKQAGGRSFVSEGG